jgi:hypothetical protein
LMNNDECKSYTPFPKGEGGGEGAPLSR